MSDETNRARRSFLTGLAGATAATAFSWMRPGIAATAELQYADPKNPALANPGMLLDIRRTALVVIDPQIDFMSPKGASWPIAGESVTEQRLVPNLIRLFDAAKKADITVAISPHYYYPWDYKWKFGGPLETLQHELRMFDRRGPLTLEGFSGSRRRIHAGVQEVH